jgi:signal transduction histidine kinase
MQHFWTGSGAGISDRRASSTRVALATGFAIVFALWLLWGYQLGRSLENIEKSVATVHEQYVRGEQTLSTVRTNVLLGSIYLRDALIDSAPENREGYRAELGRLRQANEQAMTAYVPAVESAVEREHWGRLQSELREFWESRELALAANTLPRTPAQAAALLRTRVVPRRETILGVLDQLAALQREANRRRQQEANILYSQVRLRLMSMGGTTLLAALVVAVMASRHVSRLQREIERQRAAEQRNRQDLERLSARLVDAQEAERRKLARELHDEVGQALTAVKMDIGIALRSDNRIRVKNALEEASELTESTLRGVRDLSQLLHPSMLDDFGLPTTLTTYLRSFSQRTGIRAQLAETIDDRLVPAIEVCVYRIVQEAFNNIVQHSSATACTVSLTAGNGALRLVIEDNGRGLGPFPRPADARQGLGLIGMRERAQALGGTFQIENAATGGTRIAVTLPLQVAEPPATEEPERQVG